MRICGSALLAAAVAVSSACARAAPVEVGIVWGDNWTLGPITLTSAEQARIKSVALAVLRQAYGPFSMDFADDAARDRIIRLNRHLFGSGATQIGSKVSAVNLDGVHLTLLAVTGCHDIGSCPEHPRTELIEALGRGIGATAAHELGHQAGFEFVRDSRCDECYDGATSKTLVHFFGQKHWSAASTAIMNTVLAQASR